ncbi:DNA-3-methyladenine glycosylase [Candidatus Microgenomates bacterium]|nr:DNA-3-methyladenine glycosylase [Candidatus Microgenomates bacterium]
MARLPRYFFNRGAEVVARDLLGKKLCRRLSDGRVLRGIITETEAYLGGEDLASHSRLGLRTERNEVMYGKPGIAYVYFTYGMHWMLNFVCSKKDDPQAVLIRGLDVVSGPARLTKYFAITGAMNGVDVTKSRDLWMEEGITIPRSNIVRTSRIGVEYAKEWKDEKLRFVLHSQILEKLRIVNGVYEIVKSIPRGKVATYGWVAKKVGISPRVVGNTLHKNVNPQKIPCHRVVNSKGKLAENYAFGGAKEQARKLRVRV